MPEQTLFPKSPEAAAREAVARVMLEGSDLPLVDAANLLIQACRDADRRDPGWADFLENLDLAEIETLAADFVRAGRPTSRTLRAI